MNTNKQTLFMNRRKRKKFTNIKHLTWLKHTEIWIRERMIGWGEYSMVTKITNTSQDRKNRSWMYKLREVSTRLNNQSYKHNNSKLLSTKANWSTIERSKMMMNYSRSFWEMLIFSKMKRKRKRKITGKWMLWT